MDWRWISSSKIGPQGGSVNSGMGAGIRMHVTGALESLYADAGNFPRKEISEGPAGQLSPLPVCQPEATALRP